MAKGAAGRGRRGSAAEPEPPARPRLELVGHGEARRRVAAAAERGQLGPALLVTGPLAQAPGVLWSQGSDSTILVTPAAVDSFMVRLPASFTAP